MPDGRKAIQPADEGFVDTQFNRRLSWLLTKLIVRTRLTPNQVTWISFIVLLPGLYFLSTGERTNLVIAGILIQLSYTLDCCDDEVSRLKNLTSTKGAWLDGALDRIGEAGLFTALGFGLYRQTGQHTVWLFTFLAFAALFLTHTITLMTAQSLGKGTVKASQEVGRLGRLCSWLRIRPSYFRIGIDLHLMVFTVGAIANKLMWINYFFITIQNLYWIALFTSVLARKEPQTTPGASNGT